MSDADEPYVLFEVVPVTTQQKLEFRTRVYGESAGDMDGVNAGEAREDAIDFYRGLPYGLAMVITLMELDFGNPDKYRDLVKLGVEKASEAVGYAVQHIPVIGPTLAVVAGPVLKEVGPYFVSAFNNLLGTEMT